MPTTEKEATIRIRELYSILNPNSSLDGRNRLRIANCIALPSATYGQEVRVTGSLKASSTMTTTQNITHRKRMVVYMFTPNEEIRQEVKAVELREQAWQRRRQMIERLLDHPREDVSADDFSLKIPDL